MSENFENKNNLLPVQRKEAFNDKWLMFKRKISNIVKNITNSKLSKNDPYTIQEQLSHSTEDKNFYIRDGRMQYLTGNPGFTSVRLLQEDKEKNIYVYLGIVSGASNAIGMLQTDVPIEDIISSPNGNELLENILKKDYAKKQCEECWKSRGVEFDENGNGSGNFFKPSFNLGCISSNGKKFEFSSNITKEIETLLDKEKEKEDEINARIEKDNILYKFDDLIVANTYISRYKSIDNSYLQGVNLNGCTYKYTNIKLINKEKNSFTYLGTLTTGDGTKVKNTNSNNFELTFTNNTYENVIIELPGSIDYIVSNDDIVTTDNVIIANGKGIADVFAQAFVDKNVEHNMVKEDGVSYSFVGKINQFDEESEYTLDNTGKLKPEIINALKEKNKIKKEPQNANVIDISMKNKSDDELEF